MNKADEIVVLIDGCPLDTNGYRVTPPAPGAGTLTAEVTYALGSLAPIRKRPKRVAKKLLKRGGYVHYNCDGVSLFASIMSMLKRLMKIP